MGVEPLSPPPSPVTDLVPSPQLVEEADEAVYEKERAVVVSSREITTSKKVVTHRRTYSYSTLLGSVNLGLSQVEEKGALTRASKSNRKSDSVKTNRYLLNILLIRLIQVTGSN